jgi:hypothetical protein
MRTRRRTDGAPDRSFVLSREWIVRRFSFSRKSRSAVLPSWREPGQWLGDCHATRIEQGYLAIEGEGRTEVRLRRRDGETVLTVKRGSGRTRAEEEIDLEPEQFEALWPLTAGKDAPPRAD